MRFRYHLCVGAVLALILIPTVTAAAETGPDTDKAIVTDGRYRHDLADLQNHVTNWGLIGSAPNLPTPFSHAPSARWPGAGGVDHLFAAGLWVGARVLGETLVTTGGYSAEFRPTEAPEDTVQAAYHGMPGGLRYPWPGADDDGDGREDEDPLNARDDDGDGLVDEDCAAVGQQHFFATAADTAAALQEIFADHSPLGIEVLQQSFQWTDAELAGVIGYDFEVTNIGDVALDDLHVGLYSDFDIGDAADDQAGLFRGLVRAHDGTYVPVDVAYMRDGAAAPVGGHVGWVMCGLERNPTRVEPDDGHEALGCRIFSGQRPFAEGGDPTNDAERYELLSSADWDGDTIVARDYRVLLTAGPAAALAPGESVTVRFALVAGADRDAMLLAAAEAVWTAWGRTFDRDGDPANGQEFAVRWLSPHQQTVPGTTPRLRAGAAAGGVRLRCDLRGATGPLAVERRAATGVPWRRWEGWDGRGELVDADRAGWPRVYDLLQRDARGAEKIVDTVEVAGAPAAGLRLAAGPNPFNPLLNVSYHLPEACSARLTVHSLRGELVRVLHDGPAAAGEGTATWHGEDQAGRSMASGVYLVRLATARRAVERRVTLVR